MEGERAEILIVEDDEIIARLMQMHLRAAGWRTHHVENGNDALDALQHGGWKLVVLDRMLPGKSGMQVLRWLQRPDQDGHIPVLMVTALGSTADTVQGLNEGADDYLAKPFEPEELVARVNALMRRSAHEPNQTLRSGDIEVDVEAAEVRIGSAVVALRRLEFLLLLELMKKPGKVRSRDYLLDHVWGSGTYVEPRTVDVTIKRLRKALADFGCEDCIDTVRGMGYRFTAKGSAD
ncbi:MAG TPA: response regulator [Mariprofundaceae bacterium]|nr:response regulator [Mariprofundaceae bacterium]